MLYSGKEKWGPGTHVLQAGMSKGRMEEKEPAEWKTVARGFRVEPKREGSFEKLEFR